MATLEALAKGMAPGKTICALSDAAAIPTLSAVRLFKDELIECVTRQADPLAVPQPHYAVAGGHH